MDFLLDANMPRSALRALTDAGHLVILDFNRVRFRPALKPS